MQLIDTQKALDQTARTLGGSDRLYVDTEFESTRDGKTLSLLQVSGGGDIYLVDALRLPDLGPLARAMTEATGEWVLHAGLQDVELLVERFDLREPPPLFDTQIAWALLGPEASVSLAYLQFKVLGLRAMKPHQADDWMRRPLPRSQLAYAAADVEHLPALRRELGMMTAALGREDAVAEATREQLWPAPNAAAPLALAAFRNAWQLDLEGQAGLRFLIEWYNGLQPRNRLEAPSHKTLMAIASRKPTTVAELGRIKGVSRRWCTQHGPTLVSGLKGAIQRADAATFVGLEPPPYATFEEIRLDAWLQTMRAETCARVRIAPDLAFSGRLLRAIRDAITEDANVRAGVQALCGWRHRLLSEAYLEHCDSALSPWP